MLHWLATLEFVCINKLKLPSDLAQVGDIQLSEKSVSRVVSRWWKRNRSASDFLCVLSLPRQLRLVNRRCVLGAQEPIARTLVSQECGNATLAGQASSPN